VSETDEYMRGERAASDFYSVWCSTLGDGDSLARAVAKLLELDLADEPALRGFLRQIEKRLVRPRA
jgi:hypothetical protein